MQTRFNYGVVIIMKHTQQVNTHTHTTGPQPKTTHNMMMRLILSLASVAANICWKELLQSFRSSQPNSVLITCSQQVSAQQTGLTSEAVQPLDERPPPTLLINTKVITRRTLSSQTQIPVADVHSQMFRPAPLTAAN